MDNQNDKQIHTPQEEEMITHIRCLSAVPFELEELLKEIDEEAQSEADETV